MAVVANLPWQPLVHPSHKYSKKIVRIPVPLSSSFSPPLRRHQANGRIYAFRRSDFDGFAKRLKSGEAWRDAWRVANDGLEQFVYEAKKAAESLDRRYSVSRGLSSVAGSAMSRAREIDREFEVSNRWRTFTLDFSRNLPRYRKELGDFVNTPLGKSFTSLFFVWFLLSGWLFRILIFATWVLPIAGPLLIGTVAKNFVVQGACPSCKRQFIGNKSQIVRCAGCGNIVWQPEGDFFSRGTKGSNQSRSKSQPEIIDVEFEEK